MNKDFSQAKLISMTPQKQFKVLYDLALFIEKNRFDLSSNHFQKLTKYHHFLNDSQIDRIQKLNKEFKKIKDIDYQFQIYLMNLERALGQSTKEYEFLVTTQDKIENESNQKRVPIVCVLDSIRSAHNIGAILRTSECLNIEEVILTGLSPAADSVHVQKTAMNAENYVPNRYVKSALEVCLEFRARGYLICAVETHKEATNLYEFSSIAKPIVLIFGHEQFGVSKELIHVSDFVISIPLTGVKNSLNVSVSHGIVLSELIRSIKF